MTAARRPAADAPTGAELAEAQRRLVEARARAADPRAKAATPVGALVTRASSGPTGPLSRSAGSPVDDRPQGGGVVAPRASSASLDAVERMARAFRGGAWETSTVLTWAALLDAEVRTQGWTDADIARGTAEMVRAETFPPSAFATWRGHIARAARLRREGERMDEMRRDFAAADARREGARDLAAVRSEVAREMAFDPRCRGLSTAAFDREFQRRLAAKKETQR